MTFFSYPGNGTGVPHFKSLVIPRGSSPVRIHDWAMLIPFWLHLPFVDDSRCHLSISGWSLSKRRKVCFVSRGTGVVPSILHFGSMSCKGSKRLPQPSHWSPRASWYWQIGQVPSTNLSARKAWCSGCSQNGCFVVFSSRYPFLFRAVKISWAMSVCCVVGVLPKMSNEMSNQS